MLYIDIDVHHGDGVEEAFYGTNRVLSFSLHKFGDGFFPGTGSYKDIGVWDGKYHAVNFPFDDGIDDDGYFRVYTQVIDAIFERYQPNVVVLQCGADSLSRDRIGVFNLSSRGHGRIVEYMKQRYNCRVPMLVVGGGGYSIRNVARLWCYETSVLCNEQKNISDTIPYSDFMSYYAPHFKLHIDALPASMMTNKNSTKYLQTMTAKILQQIKNIEIVPSVQINTPRIAHISTSSTKSNGNSNGNGNENEEQDDIKMADRENEISEQHPDQRVTVVNAFSDQYVAPSNEFYDGEKDQDTNTANAVK